MIFDCHRRSVFLNITALAILFVGYFLTTGTGVINSDALKSYFRLVSLLIFLGNIFAGGVIKPFFVNVIIFLIFALILSQSAIAINVIFLVLIAASLQKLNIKELAITLLTPTMLVILLHILLLITGRISGEAIVTADRTRSSFGFDNPNQVSAIYFSFVCISIFTYVAFKNKKSFFLLITSSIWALYLFLAADSRTSLLGLLVVLSLIIFNFIFKNNYFYLKFSFILALLSPIMGVIITIFLINSAGTEVDIILSLRPYFFSELLKSATLSEILLGWDIKDGAAIDNLFLMLLSAIGVIGCIVMIFWVSFRFYKMKPEFHPLVTTLMYASVFESFLIRPEIPCAVLFVGMIFSSITQKPGLPPVKNQD